MSIIPNYVPSGFHVINVMLPVKNAQKALEWYNRAFGAEEVMRLTDPNGVIVHAEMKIADTIFMLAEEDPRYNSGSTIVQLYVPDVEGMWEEAIKAGAEVVFPLKEQFYGDRAGRVKDPFGHQWILGTHVESLTAREMQKRFNDMFQMR